MTIAEQMVVGLDAAKWWDANAHLGPTDRFTRFFRDVLLRELHDRRIAVFFDEIDTTLSLPFRGVATDDFFAALRALHLERDLHRDLARLSIVLIGVAEPTDLIKDPDRTPFSVGRKIELIDFSESEAEALMPASGIPLEVAQRVLRQVLAWTSYEYIEFLRQIRTIERILHHDSKGNRELLHTHRVQPDGTEPPYLSQSATCGGRSFRASSKGAQPTVSNDRPVS
jgi:hypothetical protein